MLTSANPTVGIDPNYTLVPLSIGSGDNAVAMRNNNRYYSKNSTVSAPISVAATAIGPYDWINIRDMPFRDCIQMCTNDPTCQALVYTNQNTYCQFNTGTTNIPGVTVSTGNNYSTLVKNQNTCSGANQVFDSKSKSCVSCRDPTVKPSVINSPSASSYTCNNSSIKTFDKNNSLVSSTCDSGEVFNTLTNTCSITYNY